MQTNRVFATLNSLDKAIQTAARQGDSSREHVTVWTVLVWLVKLLGKE